MREYLKLLAVGLVSGLVAGLVVGWLVSNQPDLKLGVTGTRFPNGISVGTTTSPSTAGGLLIVQGGEVVTGTSTLGSYAGIEEFVSANSCGQSTSTLFSILNPFAATSTAKLQRLEITGTSTSAITVNAGTSTLPAAASGFAFGIPTIFGTPPSLIASSSVAIGLYGTWIPGARTDVLVASTLGSGGASEILVGPLERVTAIATSTDSVGQAPGLDGLHNRTTFACNYKILWRR